MKFNCAHCGKVADKPSGQINRSRAIGMRLFCSRACFGLDRRTGKTRAQKVAEKAAYDAAYREKNREMLKAKKREYFKRTYDPVAAAVYRKKRMPIHVEYCRQPEYRVKKSIYDRKRRDAEYGEFAEVARLTIDLNRAIKERATNEQIRQQSGTANKTQNRKRTGNPEKERSRPRGRWRSRPGVAAPHSQ